MEPKDFLKIVKSECKEHGVKLRISPYKRVRTESMYCGGYFSEDPLELAVARKNKNFWSILVHEFCHMQQWIEQSPVWTDTYTMNGNEAWDVLSYYLDGWDYPDDELDEAFRIIIRCERDCDMRAVKMVKKYNLPIDVKLLIKQSNAYHWSYHVIKEKRIWPGKEPSYTNKKVLELCPDTFRTNPERGIPDNIKKIMMECIL